MTLEYFISPANEINRGLFLNGLRAGLGLSASAGNIHMLARDISEYIQKNEDFKKACMLSLYIGYQAKLSVIKVHMEQKKWSRWEDNVKILPRFVAKLNLWEDYCKKGELTDDKLLNAIMLYKVPEEIATVIGMHCDEFYEHLLSKDAFYEFFGQYGITLTSYGI